MNPLILEITREFTYKNKLVIINIEHYIREFFNERRREYCIYLLYINNKKKSSKTTYKGALLECMQDLKELVL